MSSPLPSQRHYLFMCLLLDIHGKGELTCTYSVYSNALTFLQLQSRGAELLASPFTYLGIEIRTHISMTSLLSCTWEMAVS